MKVMTNDGTENSPQGKMNCDQQFLLNFTTKLSIEERQSVNETIKMKEDNTVENIINIMLEHQEIFNDFLQSLNKLKLKNILKRNNSNCADSKIKSNIIFLLKIKDGLEKSRLQP